MKRKRLAWWTVGALALAVVFASYLQRDFVFSLASQAWACF